MAVKNASYKDLKEGKYVMIDGEPCRILTIEKSKPGKHGAAKCRVTAVGIFDNKRRGLLGSSDQDVQIPVIEKGGAQVVAVMGDNVQLMDLESYETFDMPMPEDLKGEIEAGKEVEYQKLDKRRMITRVR